MIKLIDKNIKTILKLYIIKKVESKRESMLRNKHVKEDPLHLQGLKKNTWSEMYVLDGISSWLDTTEEKMNELKTLQ